MQRQARVIAINNQTGLIGLQPEGEDRCVLVQQLDTRPVNTGQMLSGEMDSVGMETFVNAQTQDRIEVFVEAYGLSAEAVELAMR
ncbi:hypothetical protein [Delftia sp. CH05]|uniref:hypothetical protein n=1 Tax=Delftia sp. CH05 TaxID=2692194 RepID=UPI00135F0F37|nr:hypothetical protein [Delftia sp. CH05]MXN32267.1 hypothetical protein [Delftia sp. CH05]